ncbi:GFA family protein [Rhodovulum sulfidophilum]|uniref:GFA family protein n=1 Tax=Rhodovulum sulfidophilum TaxID=35806 RepID=UPI001389C259|nr:GFA family protein [Rhodovulum sulfidophilum]NDK33832.1 GFA family protein [Rhodovulum sulfidophilum]
MTVTGSCLCSQCRKASGHHVAATTVLRDDLVIEGEVRWYASSAGAQRGFCPVCGSNMFWDGGQDYLAVFAGTLDGDPAIRMAAHVFCADKGAYYEITDGLPQAPGLPEDIA